MYMDERHLYNALKKEQGPTGKSKDLQDETSENTLPYDISSSSINESKSSTPMKSTVYSNEISDRFEYKLII